MCVTPLGGIITHVIRDIHAETIYCGIIECNECADIEVTFQTFSTYSCDFSKKILRGVSSSQLIKSRNLF